MKKVGLVVLGYVVAVLIAVAVVAAHMRFTSGPDASGGMQAFGDALLFVGVLGVGSLVPTGMALFFLRPYRRVWTGLAWAVVVVAITGVTAATLFAVTRHAAPATLSLWAELSVLRMLAAPLLALAFFVCAVFAPSRSPRLAMLSAVALEALVSLYGAVVWIVPLLLDRP